VTMIGAFTFSGCTDLAMVSMGNAVISIGEGAFAGCTSLRSIVIPSSVKHIGDNAFLGCSSLTGFTFQGDAPSSLGSDAFSHVDAEGITIPHAAGSAIYTKTAAIGFGEFFGGLPVVTRKVEVPVISGVRLDEEGNFIIQMKGSTTGMKLMHWENSSTFIEVKNPLMQDGNLLVVPYQQGGNAFFRVEAQ